jgi:WD40 repeat protein
MSLRPRARATATPRGEPVGGLVVALALVASCQTPAPVDDDLSARLRAAPPGSHVTGTPTGLGAPEVINRRDFIYAVAFDDRGAELAFAHHVTTHMELTVTGLQPLAPRFQQKVNESEFDLEDVVFVGGHVVVPSRQGTLRAFDRTSGRMVHEVATGEPLLRVALAPDRGALAVSTAEGRVMIFDAATLALRGEGRLHDDEIRGLGWLPDGRLLSAAQDGFLKAARVDVARDPVVRATTSALASGERVFLAHIEGRQAIATIRDARQPTTIVARAAVKRLGLASRADGATLPVATADGPEAMPAVDVGQLQVRALSLGAITAAVCDACLPAGAELLLGQDVLARASFTEDIGREEFVVRASGDGARLVDGAVVVVVDKTLELPGPANDVDVAATGPVLVTFAAARAERSFDIHDAEQKGKLPPPSPQSGAAFVDVDRFALGKRFVNGHLGFTVTGAVSPDGRTVVTGGWDKRVLVWDAVTGEIVTERTLAWLLRRSRFAPLGDRLAVAAWTPVNALNEGDSEPALLLYPLTTSDSRVVSPPAR